MKLSNLTAKLTCIKSNTTRILAAATLAGAVLAAAPAAQAQRVFFGARIGPVVVTNAPRPVYVAPDFYGPAYVAPPVYVDHRFDHDWDRDHRFNDRDNHAFDHHQDRFGRR